MDRNLNQHPTSLLAIESSCDETAAAVIIDGVIMSNVLSTQPIHETYGGVVPEFASRAHQNNIVYVVDKALNDANIRKEALSAIAFTQGPGLLGSLLIGSSFAKSLAFAHDIPLIAVHHMKGHVLANFIDPPHPNFPFLCLAISGGHTQILLVRSHITMEVIGTTQDDAVGEAFDKIAKIMDLPYPGGPLIDKYAAGGDATRFSFPTTKMPQLDFSFSGIKTAFLTFFKKKGGEFIHANLTDVCASIQAALVNMLVSKLELAITKTGITRIAMAGGVAANSQLRKKLRELTVRYNWEVFIPQKKYCTDNGAMIAMAAHYAYLRGEFSCLSTLPLPRFPF